MAANYYTTPLVKVGDSATIFTANIYLSDASNVGSFDLELVVSGNPSDVSYSYAAANLAGFTVFAGMGISGLWTNSDSAGMLLGGFFPTPGLSIGSVTVTFATAPLVLPKLVVGSADLSDINLEPIAVSVSDPGNTLPTGLPLMLGVPTENQSLNADASAVADVNGLGAFSYQWQRSENGTDWVNIEQGTEVTYKLGDADALQQVRVEVSYTDGGGTLEVVRSAQAMVANVNDLPTGSVNISGAAAPGQNLTASNTLADADGMGKISYQWLAGGTAISGATSSTYVITSAEKGKGISVEATYTDAHGTAESVMSPLTSVVSDTSNSTGARFYTTPLVKVGDSATIFTANIYLSGAANVATFGVELGVSGAPSDVSLSYSAANVLGFTSLAGVGISGFANSFDAFGNSIGGTFPSAGVSIGSVVLSFSTAPTAAPKLVLLSAELEDVNSDPIAVSMTDAGAGGMVDAMAYSWKAHTLLSDVSVAVAGNNQSFTTNANGALSFAAASDPNASLSATRAIPTAEAVATSAAVSLQDAIAILKMIVGLDVNGTGKALSPYQALAADYDGNGLVQLSDAIGVLKHVVGLSAPDPTWHFVNELDSTVPAKANLAPGVAQTNIAANLSGSSPVHVGLVGYLSGDVDGSFAGATGATALNTSYFTSLVAAHTELVPGFNLAQFGIYG